MTLLTVYYTHHIEWRKEGGGVCALFTISLGMFEISNIPINI
jgi:hypothetical protein